MELTIERLAATFRRFSEVESQQMSPFYSLLAGRIASDPDVLAVAAHSRPGQPPPNMLFGAVRLLLDRGADPELLSFYPVSGGASVSGNPYPLFRQFVLENSAVIAGILETRSVQSNVVRRAAVLLLGLMKVSEITGGAPFANIEIGASLGITLLWQKFFYEYGPGLTAGDARSPVRIKTRLAGDAPFPTPLSLPPVISNTGIDLSPVRMDDAEGLAWLEALIWPEHHDNRELWRAAIPLAAQDPPRVLEGDALKLLPEVAEEVEAGAPVSVYHSHTLNQFSPEAKARLEDVLCRLSASRRICRVSFEGEGPHSALRVFEYSGGNCVRELHFADCEAHGRWINWRG